MPLTRQVIRMQPAGADGGDQPNMGRRLAQRRQRDQRILTAGRPCQPGRIGLEQVSGEQAGYFLAFGYLRQRDGAPDAGIWRAVVARRDHAGRADQRFEFSAIGLRHDPLLCCAVKSDLMR